MKGKGRKAHFSKCLIEEKPQPMQKRKLAKIVNKKPAPVQIFASDIYPKPLFSFDNCDEILPKQEVLIATEKSINAEASPPPEPIKEETPIENIEKEEEAKVEVIDPPLVAQLVSMGFDRNHVVNVLDFCSDIETALEHLLNI